MTITYNRKNASLEDARLVSKVDEQFPCVTQKAYASHKMLKVTTICFINFLVLLLMFWTAFQLLHCKITTLIALTLSSTN